METPPITSEISCFKKHLHVRGENAIASTSPNFGIETPPRAWRKLLSTMLLLPMPGNTSTCVEKTFSTLAPDDSSQKHLHVRGENFSAAYIDEYGMETPPRAWRKLCWMIFALICVRNTSTCVEKTCTKSRFTNLHKKHLHVRGENQYAQLVCNFHLETPPRAWRKPP